MFFLIVYLCIVILQMSLCNNKPHKSVLLCLLKGGWGNAVFCMSSLIYFGQCMENVILTEMHFVFILSFPHFLFILHFKSSTILFYIFFFSFISRIPMYIKSTVHAKFRITNHCLKVHLLLTHIEAAPP